MQDDLCIFCKDSKSIKQAQLESQFKKFTYFHIQV